MNTLCIVYSFSNYCEVKNESECQVTKSILNKLEKKRSYISQYLALSGIAIETCIYAHRALKHKQIFKPDDCFLQYYLFMGNIR